MLTEFILMSAMQATWPQPTPIADAAPYESVNESEKLYSETEARTVKGVITDTRKITLRDGVEFLQIDVETDRGMMPVHLGPAWYMDEYAERFDVNKGRSVSVVGSVGVVQGKEVLIAAELQNEDGHQHMRLRNPSGVPAWVGSERAQ
jgi:hypothetical protein